MGIVSTNTTHQPPHEDVVTCESDFPDFSHSPTSPLALSLDEGMFERLSPVATRGGTTLEDVIALGLYSPSHPVGVVLCDAECCSTFSELYRAVLRNVSSRCCLVEEPAQTSLKCHSGSAANCRRQVCECIL